jgi:thiol-disulfide isomerase/thioredoxin
MGFDSWELELSLRAVIVLIPVMLAVSACDRQAAPPSQPNALVAAEPADGTSKAEFDVAQKGKAAPTTVFTGPDGKPVTLAAFRGKAVLVNLWATWCGPCVKEMPALDAIAGRSQSTLAVITVNQGDDAAAVGKWWSARTLNNLAPYRDDESKLGFAFETGMLPTTVLYDKDGKEVWRIVGGTDWDGAEAQERLVEIMG